MFTGQLIFAQLMELLPRHDFNRIVTQYRGNLRSRGFSCRDQYLCMAFAQLTYRESLRDIETCLRSLQSKLYHAGFRGRISRSTLGDANRKRDWRIYHDFAQVLIARARALYASEPFGVELQNTVYALDSTTIDLCLNLFPWAKFRQRKAAVKLHTLLDLRGNIPAFIHVSPGKTHDVNILDQLFIEPGAFYVMDKGYVDYTRLFRLHRQAAFFVTRCKKNMTFTRRASRAVDKACGLRADQTIALTGVLSAQAYHYYRCTYYNKPDHPRTRVTEAQLDQQILALFDRMRIEDQDIKDWIRVVLASKTRDSQQEAQTQRAELLRQLKLISEQKDRLLNLRIAG